MALIAMVAISGLLYYSVHSLNKNAAETQRHLVESALAIRYSQITDWARDYSWWNGAIENLLVNPNPVWANDNIGEYAAENLGMSAAFVVGRENRTRIGFVEGEASDVRAFDYLGSGLEVLMAEARNSPYDPVIPATGLIKGLDGLFIVSVSPFTPETLTEDTPRELARPVLIFTQIINQELLSEFEDQFLLKDLRYSSDKVMHGSSSSILLTAPSGDPVGFLAWTNPQPGNDLFNTLALPIFVFTVLIAVLAFRAIRASQRSAANAETISKNLEVQNQALIRNRDDLRQARLEAQRSNEAKSLFLANMSHELRTPLNAIIGFSDLIIDFDTSKGSAKRLTEYATDIRNSGDHLLQNINDLLDIAKIEAGKQEINSEQVVVADLVNEVARMFQFDLDEKKHKLSIDLEKSPNSILSDRYALAKIMSNLLSNAIKYTEPKGAIAIRVVGNSDPEASSATFSVVDNGIGISKANTDRMLKPFEKLDNSYQAAVGGTGLGLALVHGLAKLMAGSVAIESTLGTGTTVSVTIPVAHL